MPRPIHASVSLSALRHNLALARQLAPGARVWAVVKANAYGHGIARVYGALASADGIAMLDLDEAVRVRELGFRGPILLLEGCFDESDLALVEAHDLTTVVHCDEQIDWIATRNPRRPIAVYLKVNCGMNRLGFAAARAREVHGRLSAMAQVGEITLMSHFANADQDDGVDGALAAFERAVSGLPGARSLANSAAIVGHRAAHADWIRPGIMLYGATPRSDRSAADLGLMPVMTLSSSLIAVRTLQRGDAVGYGAQYVAQAPMRVGVVACGYADGYPRIAAEGTPVAVCGLRTRLVGRVSMDMLTVDLSGIEQARVGSPVELWGRTIAVDEVAQGASTSGYELLCAVAPRVSIGGVA